MNLKYLPQSDCLASTITLINKLKSSGAKEYKFCQHRTNSENNYQSNSISSEEDLVSLAVRHLPNTTIGNFNSSDATTIAKDSISSCEG